jgi:hypothetical protein
MRAVCTTTVIVASGMSGRSCWLIIRPDYGSLAGRRRWTGYMSTVLTWVATSCQSLWLLVTSGGSYAPKCLNRKISGVKVILRLRHDDACQLKFIWAWIATQLQGLNKTADEQPANR